jgi:hypothetical protein
MRDTFQLETLLLCRNARATAITHSGLDPGVKCQTFFPDHPSHSKAPGPIPVRGTRHRWSQTHAGNHDDMIGLSSSWDSDGHGVTVR